MLARARVLFVRVGVNAQRAPFLWERHSRAVPDDPVVHAFGKVGVSSRWWYLPGMFSPTVETCRCCTGKESAGQKLTRRMGEAVSGPVVGASGELYRIPVVDLSGHEAKQCVTWPRYLHGEFSYQIAGVSTVRPW